jgi:hypothetical protein
VWLGFLPLWCLGLFQWEGTGTPHLGSWKIGPEDGRGYTGRLAGAERCCGVATPAAVQNNQHTNGAREPRYCWASVLCWWRSYCCSGTLQEILLLLLIQRGEHKHG